MSGGGSRAAGQASSAKTVFAGQFLAEGRHRSEPGVFATLDEPAENLRANLRTLGWDVATWEQAGEDRRWAVPRPLSSQVLPHP